MGGGKGYILTGQLYQCIHYNNDKFIIVIVMVISVTGCETIKNYYNLKIIYFSIILTNIEITITRG